jgi:D-alanyl-D-alanine carboxypeptidase
MSSLSRRWTAYWVRLVLALCIVSCGLSGALAEPLQTAAPQVILIEASTGSVLFEKGADDLVNPASTAKLMTAELIFARLKAGTLRKDQLFTVSQTAWREGGAASGGSTMFAKPRSEIAVQDLLRGLIIDSGNDAAITLAEGIAGSEGAFATLMTRRARELGLPHLTFTDAWGNANPAQKVTARDMAKLANHIITDYPDEYRLFAEREFTWNKIRQPNRNPLLGMNIGADGLKTGSIDEKSGYAIIGSAVQGGKRLILALYGARKASERAEEARKSCSGDSVISNPANCSERGNRWGLRQSMVGPPAASRWSRPVTSKSSFLAMPWPP